MEIFDSLKKDHEKVKNLMSQLVESSHRGEGELSKELVKKIRDELIPHARAEEAVFYNSLRELNPAKDLVKHSYKEHLEAETILRTLQTAELFSSNWPTLAEKLREAVTHHIQEEEMQVFPVARQLLLPEEAKMMDDAFQSMKPKIRDESFVETTIEMLANMMPERLRRSMRRYRPQNFPHA